MIDAIESRIQAFVQNWIADPSQWSGISLDWQLRGAYILMALGVLGWSVVDALHKRWGGMAVDGLLVPLAISTIVYGLSGPHKMVIAKESKWFGLIACLLTIQPHFGAIDITDISIRFFALGMALRHYLARCKRKPPSGNLKLAQENA